RTSGTWDSTCPVSIPPEQLERRRLVNDTSVPFADTLLHDRVVAQALETPERMAVITTSRSLSYSEMLGRAVTVATALQAQGLMPGDFVAILMDKGWEQIVGVVGSLMAGAVYIPVDTNQPRVRRDQILADSRVRHVLTQSWLAAADIWPEGVQCIDVNSLPPAQRPLAIPQRAVHPGDL